MEIVGDRLRPEHGDARRQVGTRAERPAARAALGVGIKMHDLAGRVHPGVGAPGAGDFDRLVGDLRQRSLDRGLRARTMAQPLPTVEIGAVVFDAECDAQN